MSDECREGSGHDEFCESEFISGPNAYTPCACDVRATVPPDVRQWLDETYYPEGVAIWMRSYRDGGKCASIEKHRGHMIAAARTPSGGT